MKRQRKKTKKMVIVGIGSKSHCGITRESVQYPTEPDRDSHFLTFLPPIFNQRHMIFSATLLGNHVLHVRSGGAPPKAYNEPCTLAISGLGLT